MELPILDIKLSILYISKEVISSNTKYPLNEHLLFMIRDLCLNKMINSYKLNIKNKNKKFIDIYIDKIDISGILHSPNINNLCTRNLKSYYFTNVCYYEFLKFCESLCL